MKLHEQPFTAYLPEDARLEKERITRKAKLIIFCVAAPIGIILIWAGLLIRLG